MASDDGKGLAATSPLFQAALVLLFGLGIAAPPLAALLRDGDASAATGDREFRRATPFPKPPNSIAQVDALPDQFDAWYRDAFGLRESLVRWHSLAKVFALGVSPTPNLLVGKGRWIFSLGDRSIDGVRGVDVLSEEEMRAWQEDLESRKAYLEARGARFLYVLVPHKANVYPDRLPDRLAPVGPSRLDRFLDHMRAHSDVEVVELGDVLRTAREDDTPDRHLYSPHGVHWSPSGAWIAAGAILDALGGAVLPDGRWRVDDLQPVGGIDPRDSWAQRLYLEDHLIQRRSKLEPRRPPLARKQPVPDTGRRRDSTYVRGDGAGPHAVVIHDSFGPELLPFLADSFGRLDGWRWKEFDSVRLDQVRPDLVIQVYSELTLVGMRPARAAELKAEALLPAYREAQERILTVTSSEELTLHPLSGEVQLIDAATGTGVEVHVPGKTGLLELPALPPRRGDERRVLGFEIDVAADQRLAVLYRLPGNEELERRSAFLFPLEEGRNESVVELPDVDFEAPLVLGFGNSDDPILLRRVEVRVVPR